MTDPVRDLFDAKPEMARCPHLAYGPMRAGGKPRWIERVQAYALTRYDDIVEVLRAPEKFSSVMASGPGSVTPLARRLVADPDTDPELRARAQRRVEISESVVLLNADPPLHSRQRKLVNRAFTARRVLAMEPSVRKLAEDLLDAFVAGTGSMDLGGSAIAEMFSSVNEFYDYFTERIADREENPADDLLSAVISARIDGETPLTQSLDDNPSGFSFDLHWPGSAPAFEEAHHFATSNGRPITDQTRYAQAGRAAGWLKVDGERIEVDPETWYADRDHSWGLYHQRPPLAPDPKWLPPAEPEGVPRAPAWITATIGYQAGSRRDGGSFRTCHGPGVVQEAGGDRRRLPARLHRRVAGPPWLCRAGRADVLGGTAADPVETGTGGT